MSQKRFNNDDGNDEYNIDNFFDQSKKKKKLSSSVSRSTDGGTNYLTTNKEDAADATHLVKIEIYDLMKITKVCVDEQWKYADVRAKFYCNNSENILKDTKKLVYQITKDVSTTNGSKKYFYKHTSNK